VSQLKDTLAFAETEVGVTADRTNLGDLERGAGHTVMELAYPGGQTATLVVIRLALTTDALKDRKATLGEKRFPHHSTFLPPSVMWYGEARFLAYAEVGFVNALAAASDPRVPPG
jgi:hypothetical protein